MGESGHRPTYALSEVEGAGRSAARQLFPAAQSPQSPRRFIQRLIALAKCESHLLRPISRIVVEARPRHGGHANLFHQITGELDIVFKPKRTDVRHLVVCAARAEAPKPGLRQ